MEVTQQFYWIWKKFWYILYVGLANWVQFY